MRALLRPVVYVLLLALFMSLGDGPFVDEVFAEQTTQVREQAPATPIGCQREHQGASVMLVYTMLMNAGGITRHEPAAMPVQRYAVPRYASPHYASPQLSVPRQPPRASGA